MKTLKSFLKKMIVTVALFPLLALAEATPTGQMTFMLKTAGQPLNVSQMQAASLYQNFNTQLQQSIQDGAKALELIRAFEAAVTKSDVEAVITKNVIQAVDPKKLYDPNKEFFDFLELKGNEWMSPIFQYTYGNDSDDEQIYVTVNRELRDPKPDPKNVTDWTTKMRQALWHLPRFEGTSFRGTRLTADRIDKYYPKGKPASELAFVSSSIEPSTALKFADPAVNGDPGDDGKIAIVQVILGKTGRPVSFFAFQHSHEQEILFPNGTPLVTVARTPIFQDKTLNKTMVIVLQEP